MTPLQMAMVGGGDRQPRRRDAAADRRAHRLARRQDDHALQPDQLGAPIKRQTADELTRMMELVVTGGTGTPPQFRGFVSPARPEPRR